MPRSKRLRYLQAAKELPLVYFRAATGSGFHPLDAARTLTGAMKAGFLPREAFTSGLLMMQDGDPRRRMLLSRRNMERIQSRFNSPSAGALFADGGVFSRFCESSGIPVPYLYGILFNAGRGWVAPDRAIARREEAIGFLHTELPPEFVVRPAARDTNMRPLVVTRKGDRFVGLGSTMLDAEEVLDRLAAWMPAGGCLFQEYTVGHETLRILTGEAEAPLARVITLVGPDAIPGVLAASFTIRGSGEGMPEILAAVSVSDGIISRAFAFSPGGSGAIPILTHPVTGRRLAGAIVPHWVEILGVAARAARVYLPVQTVAWDIALSERGPLLLSGDAAYGPPSHVPDFASLFGSTS